MDGWEDPDDGDDLRELLEWEYEEWVHEQIEKELEPLEDWS